MKKFLIFLFFSVILSRADTIEVVIGTPYIGNYIPFWGQSYDACRFQVLFLQNEINTTGKIIKFAFQPSDNYIGTYNNFRFYFCPTSVYQLSATFDDNYAGNTPQIQIDTSSFLVGGPANQWLEWPVDFDYDNNSNLLVEIRWNGDNGVGVPMWRTNETIPRRVYNMTSDSATTGTTQNTGNYVKLTIDRGTGIKENITKPKLENLTVMPNLVHKSNNVIIRMSETGQVKIYDITGKIINSISSYNTNTINWNLRDRNGRLVGSGIYFIKAGNQSARITVIE